MPSPSILYFFNIVQKKTLIPPIKVEKIIEGTKRVKHNHMEHLSSIMVDVIACQIN